MRLALAIVATSDFGATGLVLLLRAIFLTVITALAMLSLAWGLWLLSSEQAKRQRRGLILVFASILIPLSCWIGPSLVFRLEYGRQPLSDDPFGKVNPGMTMAEVTAALGQPHRRRDERGGA